MYSSLVRPGGLIVFHDIAVHEAKHECYVERFWSEIKDASRPEKSFRIANRVGPESASWKTAPFNSRVTVVSFSSCPVLLASDLSGLCYKVRRPSGRLCFAFDFCFHPCASRRRGGKVGISRLLRDFQGSVGAGGNLLLVFTGFHAPVFSTALSFDLVGERLTAAVVTANHMGAVPDGHRSLQVLMHRHRLFGQAIPPSAFLDLPPAVPDTDGVVLVHNPFGLHGKHQV